MWSKLAPGQTRSSERRPARTRNRVCLLLILLPTMGIAGTELCLTLISDKQVATTQRRSEINRFHSLFIVSVHRNL